jgi:Methyltransferase domain
VRAVRSVDACAAAARVTVVPTARLVGVTGEHGAERPGSWEYYDHRAVEGTRTIGHALAYWKGLGVEATVSEIEAEAAEVRRLIRSMPPSPFVEVGAGPGTFTADLPGWGIALDQSEAALRVVRSGPDDTPVVRGDARRLPVRDRAVARVFAAHIYGLLTEEERRPFLSEARRIAEELVVVDAGRPPGVPAERWQHRTLGGGETFSVFRRHFDAEELAAEIDGRPMFSGRFYVMVTA